MDWMTMSKLLVLIRYISRSAGFALDRPRKMNLSIGWFLGNITRCRPRLKRRSSLRSPTFSSSTSSATRNSPLTNNTPELMNSTGLFACLLLGLVDHDPSHLAARRPGPLFMERRSRRCPVYAAACAPESVEPHQLRRVRIFAERRLHLAEVGRSGRQVA